MAHIGINGVHLNVEIVGAGPPILAIHGFTRSVATWESFVSSAQIHYTCILVDMLGHGFSDAPEDWERYRMERCIEDLEGLLDRLEIQRVHWLGYSMGGRIALSAAIALPRRTASLVVESASPGLAAPEEKEARAREDGKLADWIEEVGIERFVEHWEALPLFATQKRLSQAVRARVRAQRLANSPHGLANSLRGMGTGVQPSLHGRLSSLSAPVLFIAGAEDVKYLYIAREMHRAVTQSRLHLIPEAGHTAHLEQPERFNQGVLAFLASVAAVTTKEVETPSRSLPHP